MTSLSQLKISTFCVSTFSTDMVQAFELALAQAAKKLPQIKPEDIVFFDDSARNIKGADSCHIKTVLVGSKGASTPALAEVESLH